MVTMTAAQRRAVRKADYDVYMASCKSRLVLERITDKWVSLVVCALGESDMRYAELNRRIAGVSQKMLTQTLRNLERDGLVTRTVAPTVPVSVTYSLTELGHGLHEVLQGIKVWAEEAAAEIIIARDRYDAG
ncbi:transcriptional regulator [Gordonia amarae]|uniref:Transcriptional regulator n=2 Tax=Gordonia amarae TaxID=36821 RepID=A0A857LP68_9ACTN|nr:helix-turn-helix domain-containing protein [Gordonia amarae]MCS3880032.1 DNA-binding HxlR family transcriptional regulator [Gordonia amarae]QHN18413.1 transcriptional regulator [Gordonia amarae]QHN22895.1 transcriptional regulator [Gordonia amarae]QHN31798.1 transcriptional regulator [Gordonia amarae]QHN40544.1 transcriptional regulator [Gordonia amarae]